MPWWLKLHDSAGWPVMTASVSVPSATRSSTGRLSSASTWTFTTWSVRSAVTPVLSHSGPTATCRNTNVLSATSTRWVHEWEPECCSASVTPTLDNLEYNLSVDVIRCCSSFQVNMNMTFGTPSTDNPRPFKCHDCKIAFRIHGHLAKHLRSKMHIMKLECLGKLPFGTYAEIERSGANLNEIDTTDCDNSLESLQVRCNALLNTSAALR